MSRSAPLLAAVGVAIRVAFLQTDLIGDHDQLLGPSRRRMCGQILVVDLADGHHAFHHAAVLSAVNALRFAPAARRRGLRALTAPARSGQPGSDVMAATLRRDPAVTRGWRGCNLTGKPSYLPL